MAKDTSGNTIPIYNADGTIQGYTDPATVERINSGINSEGEAMTAEQKAFWDAFTFGGSPVQEVEYTPAPTPDGPTGMFGPTTSSPYYTNPDYNILQEGTDYSTGGQGDGTWRVFNPITGKFEITDGNYRPGDGNAIWGNVDGNRVLIRTDVEGWKETGGNVHQGDTYYDWVWGATRNVPEGWNPDGGTSGGTTQTPAPPPPSVSPPTTSTPPSEVIPPIYGAPDVPNDRPDLPVPEGGPVTPWVPGENVDTSWNWDAFAPKREGDGAWGGYDTDYQAFERYQPGMDSPWGMPDVMGGNQAFYQQQFVNLLRDEQGFRNRQRESQRLAQEALENPIEAPPIDWSWAYGGKGLKPVTEGTGQGAPTSYAFNQDYAGMSGADLWNQLRGLDVFTAPNESSKTTRDVLNNLFNDPNRASYFEGIDWGAFNDPNQAYGAIDAAAFQGMNRPNVAQQGVRTLLNQLYDVTGTGGPVAPPGYAQPI